VQASTDGENGKAKRAYGYYSYFSLHDSFSNLQTIQLALLLAMFSSRLVTLHQSRTSIASSSIAVTFISIVATSAFTATSLVYSTHVRASNSTSLLAEASRTHPDFFLLIMCIARQTWHKNCISDFVTVRYYSRCPPVLASAICPWTMYYCPLPPVQDPGTASKPNPQPSVYWATELPCPYPQCPSCASRRMELSRLPNGVASHD
jgi:hypothetical protein